MHTTTSTDRRLCDRVEIIRPCKVYDPRSRKYYPAVTRNVSDTGMLVQVARPLEIRPGDHISVGLAQPGGHAVLRHDDLIDTIVVRALAAADNQIVLGVQLESSALLLPRAEYQHAA